MTVEPLGREPLEDPGPARIVVVAGECRPRSPHRGRPVCRGRGSPATRSSISLLVDLLDRDVEVAAGVERLDVGCGGRPASPRAGCSPWHRRPSRHRTRRRTPSPGAPAARRSSARLLCARLLEHAGGLVDADDPPTRVADPGEVLARAARRVEHDAVDRARRDQPIDERPVSSSSGMGSCRTPTPRRRTARAPHPAAG